MKRPRIIALLFVGAVAAIALAYFLIGLRTDPTSPTQYVPQTWQDARTSAMHTVHVAQQKVACTECHAEGMDGGPVVENACNRCHEKQAAHAHKGSEKKPTPCQTCHVFRGGESAKPCAACHSDPKAEGMGKPPLAHHANKDIACTTCHDPHGEKDKRAALADCTGCHRGASVTHGRMKVVARDPEAAFNVAAPSMDAGADAAQTWFASAAPSDPAHVTEGQACSACHAPHTKATAATAACKSCHVEPRDANHAVAFAAVARPMVAPRGRNVAGHAACTTCHEPHRTTKADVKACVGCHGNRAHATENMKGHTACTTCHAPHAPAEAKTSCATCHANVQALSAPKVKEHAACTSCHDPHEPKRAAALACASCHSKLDPKHPQTKGDPGRCVGCHSPHPKPGTSLALHGIANACSSCHTKAKNETSFHAGDIACTTCHKQHEFKVASTALCATCHAPIKQAVAARTGHADCKSCHGAAHEPVKKPGCASCHGQEASSAPKGHATCTSCHEAHSGNLGKNASCTNSTCHGDKAKALHATGTPNGCQSCHRPHAGAKGAASPPACTTCHDPKRLPGLHSKSAHAANCSSCHTGHAGPKSDRTTCTGTCHTDRRTHQPDATLCKGCHMFRN